MVKDGDDEKWSHMQPQSSMSDLTQSMMNVDIEGGASSRRNEPIFDEDGFQMVQSKKKKGHKRPQATVPPVAPASEQTEPVASTSTSAEALQAAQEKQEDKLQNEQMEVQEAVISNQHENMSIKVSILERSKVKRPSRPVN